MAIYTHLWLLLSAPLLHVPPPQAVFGELSGNMTVSWTTVGIHILLAWLGLMRFALSDCVGSDVVTLPYENVTVLGASVKRGMQLDIGTSPQRLAFAMAGYANNTFLWDGSLGCDDTCAVGNGGIFYINQSSTWNDTASSNITASDTHLQMFNFTGKPPRGADIVHVNSSYSLYDFPLAMTKSGIEMNSLGVGRESTFLQTLLKDGAISSKTWSLFYGLAGEDYDSQMNGMAVFGGYDKAKVKDEDRNETIKLDYDFKKNCRTGMVATVTSIDVGFENGTEQNAFASPVDMCLDPAFEIMSFRSAIVDNLKEKFGGESFDTSFGQAPNGLLYNVDQAFTGNLSVTINRNLKITVPNSQLVRPDYVSLGNQTEFTDTSREILVGIPTGDDQPEWMGNLGQPFFTAAYLMVNHDRGEFTVWNSNPTEDEDYRAIDSSGAICKAGLSMPSAPSNNNGAASSDKGHGKSISPAAIAGIVIGVVAGVAIIIATMLTMFCYRKKRITNAMQSQPPPNSRPIGPIHGGYRNWYPVEAEAPKHADVGMSLAPAEAPGDTSCPAEPVEALGDTLYPRPVYELSSSPRPEHLGGWPR